MKEVTYNGLTFVPFITHEQIEARIKELGRELTREYADEKPLLVCVLNGAAPFATSLFMEIGTDAQIAFIRMSSYSGMASTGKIKEVLGLKEDIAGRRVIIVEDIVDTGHTIEHLLSQLGEKKPKDIRVATLLFKPDSLVAGPQPDYVGFSIPPKFIIGYGLDLDGWARNLKDIYVLKENNPNN